LVWFGVKFYEKNPMVVAQEKNLTWLALRKKAMRIRQGRRFFLIKAYQVLSNNNMESLSNYIFQVFLEAKKEA